MVLRRSNELFYKAHNTSQFVTLEVIKIGIFESSLVPYSMGLEMLLGILSLEEQHKDRVVMVLRYARILIVCCTRHVLMGCYEFTFIVQIYLYHTWI